MSQVSQTRGKTNMAERLLLLAAIEIHELSTAHVFHTSFVRDLLPWKFPCSKQGSCNISPWTSAGKGQGCSIQACEGGAEGRRG